MAEPLTLVGLRKFLSTPDAPVDMKELKEFKDACTEQEMNTFKQDAADIEAAKQ